MFAAHTVRIPHAGGFMNTVRESPRAVAAGQEPSAADGSRAGAPDREEFFEDALAAVAEHPDWERLIEEGAVPALALGAERRFRR